MFCCGFWVVVVLLVGVCVCWLPFELVFLVLIDFRGYLLLYCVFGLLWFVGCRYPRIVVCLHLCGNLLLLVVNAFGVDVRFCRCNVYRFDSWELTLLFIWVTCFALACCWFVCADSRLWVWYWFLVYFVGGIIVLGFICTTCRLACR